MGSITQVQVVPNPHFCDPWVHHKHFMSRVFAFDGLDGTVGGSKDSHGRCCRIEPRVVASLGQTFGDHGVVRIRTEQLPHRLI